MAKKKSSTKAKEAENAKEVEEKGQEAAERKEAENKKEKGKSSVRRPKPKPNLSQLEAQKVDRRGYGELNKVYYKDRK